MKDKIIKAIVILIIIILILIILLIGEENEEQNSGDNMNMYLKVNNEILEVDLVESEATKALLKNLKSSDITISMHDYGNFEKVGELGFSLPRNDKHIKTEPGDVILYEGNQLTIYYDTNTWSFTRLGKIKDITKDELKYILGEKDVQVTLSLNK